MGDAVQTGDVLLLIDDGRVGTETVEPTRRRAWRPAERRAERPELAELRARVGATLDAGRPAATERRHAGGRRTARENIEDLCDPGSFEEYGGLVIAAQRARRSTEDLVANTPADGLVAGIGRVNGDLFGNERSRCAVLSYDYSVLAGTQGQMNHRKKDRLFELVERLRLPVVLFAEGGGGRPGDTDMAVVTGLDTEAFALLRRAERAGAAGRHRVGALLRRQRRAARMLPRHHRHSRRQHRHGRPGHDRGRRAGRVRAPRRSGRSRCRCRTGSSMSSAPTRRKPSRWPAATSPTSRATCATGAAPDQERLRDVVPPDRRRVYDVRRAIELLADEGSVLELRPSFAPGMVTALARVEGRAVGVIANNPMHLAGAIDAANADKAARFLQLCEAFGLPILSLCDTPGFMVGPEAEETALVRHVSRMFVVGASLTVPFACVILRKGYGLGAQAMAGGSFRRPALHRGLAHRRARRHGPRGGGAPGLPA